jgi:hypothetical protein
MESAALGRRSALAVDAGGLQRRQKMASPGLARHGRTVGLTVLVVLACSCNQDADAPRPFSLLSVRREWPCDRGADGRYKIPAFHSTTSLRLITLRYQLLLCAVRRLLRCNPMRQPMSAGGHIQTKTAVESRGRRGSPVPAIAALIKSPRSQSSRSRRAALVRPALPLRDRTIMLVRNPSEPRNFFLSFLNPNPLWGERRGKGTRRH